MLKKNNVDKKSKKPATSKDVARRRQQLQNATRLSSAAGASETRSLGDRSAHAHAASSSSSSAASNRQSNPRRRHSENKSKSENKGRKQHSGRVGSSRKKSSKRAVSVEPDVALLGDEFVAPVDNGIELLPVGDFANTNVENADLPSLEMAVRAIKGSSRRSGSRRAQQQAPPRNEAFEKRLQKIRED